MRNVDFFYNFSIVIKFGCTLSFNSTQEVGRNTQLHFVFLPPLPLPVCFTTQQSTVKASLFVKHTTPV